VSKVNPALILVDKEGKPYSVRHEHINAMLLNEFLKEHKTVRELKSNIQQQTAIIVKQQKSPKDSKAYHYRADVHAKKKEYDAAVEDILRAIELDPKNGEYHLSLGWYQLFNRKPRESIAASLKALELSPDNGVMINGNLAHGYLFDNQFDKAKAIYLKNKGAKLHDGRAFSQTVLDDFKEFQETGITHPDMDKIK